MKKQFDWYKGRIESAKTEKAVNEILFHASYEATPGDGLTNREMNKLVTLGHNRRDELRADDR
jgi:hypothetical protein